MAFNFIREGTFSSVLDLTDVRLSFNQIGNGSK